MHHTDGGGGGGGGGGGAHDSTQKAKTENVTKCSNSSSSMRRTNNQYMYLDSQHLLLRMNCSVLSLDIYKIDYSIRLLWIGIFYTYH